MSISFDQVMQMSLAEITAAIKNPDTSASMQNFMRDRKVAARVSQLMLERKQELENREAELETKNRSIPPTTEELAAEAQAMAAQATPAVVPPAEPVVPVQAIPAVPVQADYAVEDAAWKAEGVTIQRDASGKIERIVQEYQVTDEDGSPIGRPTHLEARTLQELMVKQRIAHENATRAFHRLKKQKLTFKKEQTTNLTPEQMTALAEQIAQEKNPAKIQDLVRATIETSYADRELELKQKEEREEGKRISNEFMRKHLHDYEPCDANQKAIADYFVANNLEFTLDNLEAAFIDLMDRDKLVKREQSRITLKPAEAAPNTPPTATVASAAAPVLPVAEAPAAVTTPVVAQPVAPASQPVVEATVSTPAAPNQPSTARRPGVNGAIAPGTMSAHRPGPVDPALARKEFMKQLKDMRPEVMKQKLKNDPQFVKQLQTYGIRIQ